MSRIGSKSCVLVLAVAFFPGCGDGGLGDEELAQVGAALHVPVESEALLRFLPEQLGAGAGDWAAYANCLEVVSQHEDEFQLAIDILSVGWNPDEIIPDFQAVDSPWVAEVMAHLSEGVAGKGALSSADFLAVHPQIRGIFMLETFIWNQACEFAQRGDSEAAARVLHLLFQFAADLALQGDLDLRTMGMGLLSMRPIDHLLSSGWWAEHGAVLSPLVLAAGREVEQVLQEPLSGAIRTAEAVLLAQMAAIFEADTSNESSVRRELFAREVALVFARWREVEATGSSEPWVQAEALLGKGAFDDTHPIAQFLAPRVAGQTQTHRWTLARILAQRCVDAALNGDPHSQLIGYGMVATADRYAGGIEVIVNDARTEDMIVILDVRQR
tara:strand:+ start:6117 stop:7271 length:1155 start_codon:yes stop_codon:yes gene_type:complete